MMIEQWAVDNGRSQNAWLMGGLPEPDTSLLQARRSDIRPYSRLAEPTWVAAQVAYLRDVESLEEPGHGIRESGPGVRRGGRGGRRVRTQTAPAQEAKGRRQADATVMPELGAATRVDDACPGSRAEHSSANSPGNTGKGENPFYENSTLEARPFSVSCLG